RQWQFNLSLKQAKLRQRRDRKARSCRQSAPFGALLNECSQTQTASASSTRKIPSQNGAFFPKCPVVSVNSQTAVASIGKPIAILNFSIQAPGRGKNLARQGTKLSRT